MNRSFTIDLAKDWCDLEPDPVGEAQPRTLSRPLGVGALQLSTAIYRGGKRPNAERFVLLSLLLDFASSRGLGEPADIVTSENKLSLTAAASFRWQKDFVRLWYISDGSNFAMVTYTCAWGQQDGELPDCERMLETLRFTDES